MARIGGVINVQVNGKVFDAVGSFSYNLGRTKKEMAVGADRVHGYTEVPQVPFIEGEIRDASDLDVATMCDTTDATVTLKLANNKTIMLRSAVFAAEGTGATDEGKFSVRWEGMGAEEI